LTSLKPQQSKQRITISNYLLILPI